MSALSEPKRIKGYGRNLKGGPKRPDGATHMGAALKAADNIEVPRAVVLDTHKVTSAHKSHSSRDKTSGLKFGR